MNSILVWNSCCISLSSPSHDYWKAYEFGLIVEAVVEYLLRL